MYVFQRCDERLILTPWSDGHVSVTYTNADEPPIHYTEDLLILCSSLLPAMGWEKVSA